MLQLWANLLSVGSFWNRLALGFAFLLLPLPAAGWGELVFFLELFVTGMSGPHRLTFFPGTIHGY